MMVFSCETFDVESLTITTKNAGSIRLKSVVCGPCTTQGFAYTVFFLILRISPFLMMTTATELYEGSCVLIMHMLSQYFT